MNKDDDPEAILTVWAFDRDEGLGESDDRMGFIEFRVASLIESQHQSGWYKLKAHQHQHRGSSLNLFTTRRRLAKQEEIENLRGEIQLEFSYNKADEFTQLAPTSGRVSHYHNMIES